MPWADAAPGFYYVDEEAAGATDAGNPYGTPGKPRRTVPSALPAGSVVELHGRYTARHGSPRGLVAHGTANAPVFVRGRDERTRPTIRGVWEVQGTYLVLENLQFAFQDAAKGALAILAPGSRIALRNSEVRGNPSGGGIQVASFAGAAIDHVVIHNNRIHDNGDVGSPVDQDVHGIVVGARASSVWILDNLIFRNSGDGIQINAGKALQATLHHVYVGRNTSHHNKQTGFWSKQAVDVVFSQNVAYGHRAGNSSDGACMGFQYAPERVWYLFNHVHDCDVGIAAASDSDMGSGADSYFIGNLIHDVHGGGRHDGGTAWAPAGLMLGGGVNRHVIHNTIHDVDAGVASPGSRGRLIVANNVIGAITAQQGSHIFVEKPALAAESLVHHSLFEGLVRIKWGDSGTVHDLGSFRRRFRGQCRECRAGDPRFVDAGRGDFRLNDGSPAVDAGVPHEVYERFRQLYGLDIAVDITGRPRPQGATWDLGAYERLSERTARELPLHGPEFLPAARR